MSVARAREVMARLRAAGITVHEWTGWESRGNGYTSNYEGIIIHHTATPFGYAFRALVDGRPDLDGPLCNTSGNVDGSVTMIAAHPANHAGAGAGPSLGPLPWTRLFNPRVWGHEIVYPGTVPMTNEQYRTAQILSRICVDVFGYGDIERARLHAETNGRGYEGKWDAGNGNGTTYNAAEFRRGAAVILTRPVTPPITLPEEEDMAYLVKGKDKPAVYVVSATADGTWKRHVTDDSEFNVLLALFGDPRVLNQFDVDRIPTRSATGTAVWNYGIPAGEPDKYAEAFTVVDTINQNTRPEATA